MVEVVGALLSVMLIWVVTAALVYLAIERVINQDYEIKASIMIIMAGLSVVFNIVSVTLPFTIAVLLYRCCKRWENVKKSYKSNLYGKIYIKTSVKYVNKKRYHLFTCF